MKAVATKERLLENGLDLVYERGYHATGIQDILLAAAAPRGSFYHHFESKEAFCLAIIDLYAERGYADLDACLDDSTRPPLSRLRRFFEQLARDNVQYRFRRGCLLGNLGQELAGISETCRQRVGYHLERRAVRIAACLREAQAREELNSRFAADATAAVLLDSWQGALLRMKVAKDRAPLKAFIAFYFDILLTD